MASVAERNNNPGNLWTNGRVIYPGQTGNDNRGFAIFSTREAGEAAAGDNLLSYMKRGWDTPSEIAHNWSTTDQDAYTNNLAAALGVSANTPVNLNDTTVRNAALGAIFHQEDSNYKANTNPLGQSWDDIMKAATTGNPLFFPFAVGKAVFDAAHGVVASAVEVGAQAGTDEATKLGDAIKNIPSLDPGQWIADWTNSNVRNYLIPIALGGGALLFILVSAWSLVKGTPIGQTVKSGTRAAMAAAVI